MATNYKQSTQLSNWFIASGKEEMEKQFEVNMEKFDTKAKDMIICINKLIVEKNMQVPGAKPNAESKGRPVVELNSFKNYFDRFRKTKYTENVFLKCILDIQQICEQTLQYPTKILYTALSFFRRFYFVKHAIEYDPNYVKFVCVFLAAKVEEWVDIDLMGFINRFINRQEFQMVDLTCDQRKNAIREIFNHLEIHMVRALDFNFYVHSALPIIKHLQIHILEQIKQASLTIHHFQTDPPQRDNPLDIAFFKADRYAINHFNSMELIFCYSPNSIACAAMQLGLDSQKIKINDQPLSIVGMLNLNAQNSEKVNKAIKILTEVKNFQVNDTIKKELKKMNGYMTGFHSDTNMHFSSWMKIYYQHEENEKLGKDDDWFDAEDQPVEQTQQNAGFDNKLSGGMGVPIDRSQGQGLQQTGQNQQIQQSHQGQNVMQPNFNQKSILNKPQQEFRAQADPTQSSGQFMQPNEYSQYQANKSFQNLRGNKDPNIAENISSLSKDADGFRMPMSMVDPSSINDPGIDTLNKIGPGREKVRQRLMVGGIDAPVFQQGQIKRLKQQDQNIDGQPQQDQNNGNQQ